MTRAAIAFPLAALLLAACGSPLGLACGDDAACGGDDLVCIKPTVAGAPAATGVCTFAFQAVGGRCLASGDCKSPSFCSNELSTAERQFSGACAAPQPAGAACWKNSHCQGPLKCLGATASARGSCG